MTASQHGCPPAAAGKFVTPCELPSDYEREILTILIEEAAEVQQRATKLLRFGRDEVQPGQQFSNRYRLSLEIGDFNAMVELAEHLRLIDGIGVFAGEQRKYEKLKKYLQTSPPAASSPSASSGDDASKGGCVCVGQTVERRK